MTFFLFYAFLDYENIKNTNFSKFPVDLPGGNKSFLAIFHCADNIHQNQNQPKIEIAYACNLRAANIGAFHISTED